MNEARQSIMDTLTENEKHILMMELEEMATRLGYRNFAKAGTETSIDGATRNLLDSKADMNDTQGALDLKADSDHVQSVIAGGTGLLNIPAGSILYIPTLNEVFALTSVSGLKVLQNNAGVITWETATGTGAPVLATSPTLVTPNIGVAIGRSLDVQCTTFPCVAVGLTHAGAGDWAINLGSEAVSHIYIGLKQGYPGLDFADNYFWRGNWNTSGVASNTFKTPKDTGNNTLTTVNILAKASQTGDLLAVTSAAGAMSDLLKVRVGGNVGIGTTAPNDNAILDTVSTTKAFMPPRMTTTQKAAIPSPTAGMVVYDSTLNKLCVYTTAWETLTSS